MKHWRRYHKEIKDIFQADKVHYSLGDEHFRVENKTYVMEELDSLSRFCMDNKLWYYVDKNSDMDIVLVIERV